MIVKYLSKLSNLICVFTFAIFLLTVNACTKEEPLKIAAIKNRTYLPKLHATEITTLISDSGITRFRISTPQWDMYDKVVEPYWNFPKGIHFEKFNAEMKVDANIHSQYAKFKENEQLWELRGKVKATNLQGELFETELLFWNQSEERIYTDSLIKITQLTKVITGIGFESNQSMTRYTIRKPKGKIPVNEDENSTSKVQPSPINAAK
jgi:LPS export ABC transporter protein LptC